MKCRKCGGPVVELFTSVACVADCGSETTYGYAAVSTELSPGDIEGLSSTPHGESLTVFAEPDKARAVCDFINRNITLGLRVARVRVAPGQEPPECEDAYAGIKFKTYPYGIVLRYTFDCFLGEA